MRNPNGYGSVFKLSGNRRKPFAVRITKGYTDEGKQTYKYLSYHITRRETMQALAAYTSLWSIQAWESANYWLWGSKILI